MEAADTIHLQQQQGQQQQQQKEVSAFRRNVLNYIYLTFLVPFPFKFVIFYE